MTIAEIIAEFAADFALLSQGDDRYEYLIDLGRQLPRLAPHERNDANKVRGCASQVWFVSEANAGAISFRGESDAQIVQGLIAILIKLFSGRTPEEILAVDPRQAFAQLGLAGEITPQRSNGFFSMIERMRRDARAALEAGGAAHQPR